ncbi:hypothetical protein [Bradyrhizobium japonicum]|uniref:hypothetical protein n=1 Tax=Bradyrhizobium japonicum TaxID=375 RepID=UPI000A9E46F4|nr:hypothetical protein [Bradyrhizobium japonicum]
MAIYRIYRMDQDGHVAGPADFVDCADDQKALVAALQYVDGMDIEVWDGARCVGKIPSVD